MSFLGLGQLLGKASRIRQVSLRRGVSEDLVRVDYRLQERTLALLPWHSSHDLNLSDSRVWPSHLCDCLVHRMTNHIGSQPAMLPSLQVPMMLALRELKNEILQETVLK